jgi:hypothetical protein
VGASNRFHDPDDEVNDDGDAKSRSGAKPDSRLSRTARAANASDSKSRTWLAAGFVTGNAPTSAPASPDENLGDLVIEGAPPLSAVVAATLRAGGLADDPVPGWRTRSRWSALVPAVTSRMGNSQSWREVTDPTVSRALSYDVRVSWRLDRLIYDPNEPRFAAFDISRRRERRRLIAMATHAYVEWLHARSEIAEQTRREESDAPRRLIEVHLALAELDALTDGWFSHALTKPTRSR